MNGYDAGRSEEEEKGLLWKLPEVRLKDLGKVGPGFGLDTGCGVGFGVGLVRVCSLVGAGCGVGYGFGYGVGRGVAHDDKRRYSNIGKEVYYKVILSLVVLTKTLKPLWT
ncbi:hypothetical protein K2173_002344 [Erythroxylum novogranatense]|uniref:Uncharacterized protein n=1 Tax=Erythroxylum novogranatense TaxID=1862640 RepID=A0AAV8T9P3_9ROSI|nr:hypothetical protein K2173_002344 [Erythroxylum novogranatense]